MSNVTIMQDFQITFDDAEMCKRLRVKPGTKAETKALALLEEARSLAKPKAVLKVTQPQLLGETKVQIESQTFKSGLLEKHLENVETAFPYVVTCGRELADWAATLKGLEQFLADEIMLYTVREAFHQFKSYIALTYEAATLSAMNPGSLPREWPITEQRPLFDLLGDYPAQIGVELLPSYLMNPGKSVSGILFPTSDEYHNCQFCTKLNCPGRKAPYQDEAMMG